MRGPSVLCTPYLGGRGRDDVRATDTRVTDIRVTVGGGAPKLPPSMAIEFLFRHHARTGAEGALQTAGTSERMARGGIYGQLGGGFAGYSVGPDWIVPHF